MRWNEWTQLNDFVSELDQISYIVREQVRLLEELRNHMEEPPEGLAAYIQSISPSMTREMNDLEKQVDGLKRRTQSMLTHSPVHY